MWPHLQKGAKVAGVFAELAAVPTVYLIVTCKICWEHLSVTTPSCTFCRSIQLLVWLPDPSQMGTLSNYYLWEGKLENLKDKLSSVKKTNVRIPAVLVSMVVKKLTLQSYMILYLVLWNNNSPPIQNIATIPDICHFFTRAKVLENKIYTEKRQFFALNL